MRREILPALTSIRFFAAFWVVLFHVMAERGSNWPFWIRNLLHSGFVGVPLFFVLSGFILTYTYILPGEELSCRRFWIARFARIYPMHIVAFLLALPMCFWGALKGVSRLETTLSFFTTPLLIQGWHPLCMKINVPSWSLSAEAFFYLLFPFVGVWFARRSSKMPILWVALAWLSSLIAPTIFMLVRPNGQESLSYISSGIWFNVVRFNPLIRMPEFLMGIALAQQFARMRSFRFAGWYAAAAGGAIILITCFSSDVPYLYLNNSLLAPLFALLILCLAFDNGASRALSPKFLVLLGEASYSLYITHAVLAALIDSAFRHLLPLWSATLVNNAVQIVCVVSASLITYKLIEVPARRYIVSRFSSKAAATQTDSPGLVMKHALVDSGARAD